MRAQAQQGDRPAVEAEPLALPVVEPLPLALGLGLEPLAPADRPAFAEPLPEALPPIDDDEPEPAAADFSFGWPVA